MAVAGGEEGVDVDGVGVEGEGGEVEEVGWGWGEGCFEGWVVGDCQC